MHFTNTFFSFISQNVRLTVSDLPDFVLYRGFFFSRIALVFWTALFESTYGRLLLEQCFSFRGLVIIPEGPRQATSQLNDNSLLTHSNYYTFIWLLWCKFLYMVRKKLTKQTNTTVNRLAKWSFKTQLKNTLKIIF